MASVRLVLRQVPDPRGRKGVTPPLAALLGLILLSMLSGRRGMAAAHRLGRSLTRGNMVQQVVGAALGTSRVIRPWAGMVGQQVTADIAPPPGLDRPGDVVVRVDDQEVIDPRSMRHRIGLRGRLERQKLNTGVADK